MSHPAISVENLSKVYRIGLKDDMPDTLVGAVQRLVRAPLKNYRRLSRMNTFKDQAESEDTFWALRDVSFDVAEGEVIGIIGRNGAGKSTLLKILSRITEPTSGRATIRGRVSSLLEVGTGFHQELSGRENVYMNGTILGMTKREIDRKFDEIVDFSGVEKFLDTPIKHYSSGMKVRLAFSVAAHLEPEILIIDEVLAVGDAEFQKKCLGKMKDVARGGRTVLFVSHNLGAIRVLCSAACYLDEGQITYQGNVDEAVRFYLNDVGNSTSRMEAVFSRPEGTALWITEARIVCGTASEDHLRTGDKLAIEINFRSDTPIEQPRAGFAIVASDGTSIMSANNRYQNTRELSRPSRTGSIRCDLGMVPLLSGSYTINLWLGDPLTNTDFRESALVLEVFDKDIWGTGKFPTKLGYCWWPTEFSARHVETVSAQLQHTPPNTRSQ